MSAPAIRFPGEADDWLETPFDEACRSVSTRGHQLQTNAFATSGELPIVDQGASLVAGYTDNHELRFDNVPVIIFGDHTTNLKFIDFPFVVGADGTKLIQPVSADARFLYYSLLRNNVEQEGYKRHFSILREKVLSLPSLPEQRRIADALSVVDAKINLLGRKRDALARFKAGLMQKLFSQEVRFMREDGSAYPDWEENRLQEVATISKGQQLNRQHMSANGSYPVINGGITPSGYHDDFNRNAETITISEGGNSCGYVDYQRNAFWCGGHCYSLSPIEGIHTRYLYHALKNAEDDIMGLRVGSGLPNIQKRDLSAHMVPVASCAEQERIADALDVFVLRLERLDRHIATMQAFKKGLLQQMFV